MSYIGLYADKALKKQLPMRKVNGKHTWILQFPYLNTGEERTWEIYLENQSMGEIENLTIKASPPKDKQGQDKEGVAVTVTHSVLSSLELGAVHRFLVTWSVSPEHQVKAGPCSVGLTIEGVITEE